jgi:hypothetical protein
MATDTDRDINHIAPALGRFCSIFAQPVQAFMLFREHGDVAAFEFFGRPTMRDLTIRELDSVYGAGGRGRSGGSCSSKGSRSRKSKSKKSSKSKCKKSKKSKSHKRSSRCW